MQASPSQVLTTHKKVGPSKLVIGFLVAATTAIISMAGVAGATPNVSQGGGYGGGDTNVNVNIEVNGDNNNVVIILRWMFGG